MTPLELVRHYIEERGFKPRPDIWSEVNPPAGNGYYTEHPYLSFQLNIIEVLNQYNCKTAITISGKKDWQNLEVSSYLILVETYENETHPDGIPNWDCKITTYFINLHDFNALNLISKIMERDRDASDGWVLEDYPGAGV